MKFVAFIVSDPIDLAGLVVTQPQSIPIDLTGIVSSVRNIIEALEKFSWVEGIIKLLGGIWIKDLGMDLLRENKNEQKILNLKRFR